LGAGQGHRVLNVDLKPLDHPGVDNLIVDRCLKVDGLGYQVFNAGNDENGMNVDNAELLARVFSGVPVTRALHPCEALFSNAKIREVLGFCEEHPWQNYVKG
jgi:hypothetical protein